LEPASTFFIGDDQSDEHVFSSLLSSDVAVKVGPGPTTAAHRLKSPTEVVAFLRSLAERLTAAPPRPTDARAHDTHTAEDSSENGPTYDAADKPHPASVRTGEP
jgi:hypothetical protein